MAGGRNLLDALAEDATAADEIRDLGLVHRDFDCTRSKVVGGGVDLGKFRVHFSLSNTNGAALAAPR
jgi:hypothetical protein